MATVAMGTSSHAERPAMIASTGLQSFSPKHREVPDLHTAPHQNLRKPLQATFLLLLCFFLVGTFIRALFFDYSDFDYGVLSDHFINSVTARNIALGLGWSSTGYETYLLNPENLTTGVSVVLPVSLAVYLFGNELAVPGLAMWFLNVSLLAILLFRLKAVHIDPERYFLFVVMMLSGFLLLKSFYWYRLLGEIPALLFFLIHVTFLQQYFREGRLTQLLFAGLFMTLAMDAKELMLLPMIMCSLVVMYYLVLVHKTALSSAMILTGCYVVISLSLPQMFTWYRNSVISIEPQSWQTGYRAYEAAIHDHYSGINTLKEYLGFLSEPALLVSSVIRVIKGSIWIGSSLFHFSMLGSLVLLPWAVALPVCFWVAWKKRETSLSLPIMLLAPLPLLGWFFVISEWAMPRHLYMASVLVYLAVAATICSLENTAARYLFALMFMGALIATGDRDTRNVLLAFPLQESDVSKTIKATASHIANQPDKTYSWLGMVDNNELEYLMKKPNRFNSAYDQISSAARLDEQAWLASNPKIGQAMIEEGFTSAYEFYRSQKNRFREPAPYTWKSRLEFYWLHPKQAFTRFDQYGIRSDSGKLCEEIVYQNAIYIVERCANEDFSRFFEKVGGLPFRPRQWIRPEMMMPSERSEL
jgi:hypothetical protein